MSHKPEFIWRLVWGGVMGERSQSRSAAALNNAPGGDLPRFVVNASGATAAVFALALPILIGVGALALDVGVWSVKSREAQGVADQAAYSAAVASSVGSNGTTEAQAIAAGLGYKNGVGGVTVNVTNPPASGAFAGNTVYWQVTIQQPQPLGLAGYFVSGTPTVVARAVAGTAAGNSCIIGLSRSANNAVEFLNGTDVRGDCGIYSNSSSSSAISCDRNCSLQASLYAVGGVSNRGRSTPQIFQNQEPVADPYATVPKAPASGTACVNAANRPITNGGTFSAGRYCGGFSIGNNAANKTLTFNPGVFYIEGSFKVPNGFRIVGSGGVTLVFSIPRVNDFGIGNNGSVSLTAPSSGAYAGIAVMSTASGYDFEFGNGNQINVSGAFYIPTQKLTMSNNLNSNLCTQLVAQTMSLKNNGTMKSNCPGSGIKGVGGGAVLLVE